MASADDTRQRGTDPEDAGQDDRGRTRALRRPTRVMIVDDDAGMRTMIENALDLAPGRYEVVAECRDGQEAVEVARRLRPQVVLLDLDMPVMGGLEAMPRLMEVTPGVRIVICSASCSGEKFESARKGGAAACLRKGIDFRMFIDCLDTVLKREIVDPECMPVYA